MKNKTIAAWLAFVGGPLGLHRFYLMGSHDWLGWLLIIPTTLGLYGVQRIRNLGIDDFWAAVLVPLLGFTIAGCALTAIVYGLMSPEKWNARFNARAATDTQPDALPSELPGNTNWLTIGAVVLSLLIGTTVLMSSIVFSFQRYFEYQIEEAHKISQ